MRRKPACRMLLHVFARGSGDHGTSISEECPPTRATTRSKHAGFAVRVGAVSLVAVCAVFPLFAGPSHRFLRLTFFGSSTCDECAQIKTGLLEPLAKQYNGKLSIVYRDIEVDQDLTLLTALEKGYKVKHTAAQELFFPDTVLVGFDAIMENGRTFIENYLSHPEKWTYLHAFGDSTIDTATASDTEADLGTRH